LKDLMQSDRRVLWNFEHVVPGDRCTGTVEFRGGRGLRGPDRTKWWIAFVVSFIQYCISNESLLDKNPGDPPSTDYFWSRILAFARTIQVEGDLPSDWRYMNESSSSGQWEDAADGYDYDSDTLSIVSKSASEYSDSDYSSGDEANWEYDRD